MRLRKRTFQKLRKNAEKMLREFAEAETRNERYFRFYVDRYWIGSTERDMNRERYEKQEAYLERKIRQCKLVLEEQ